MSRNFIVLMLSLLSYFSYAQPSINLAKYPNNSIKLTFKTKKVGEFTIGSRNLLSKGFGTITKNQRLTLTVDKNTTYNFQKTYVVKNSWGSISKMKSKSISVETGVQDREIYLK